MIRSKIVSVKIAEKTREEFHALATMKGTTMSSLLHQWVMDAIRQTRREFPEEFEASLQFVRQAEASGTVHQSA